MNLKSYLRGAGIGIIITALILMVSGGNKSHAMTDNEIMARARELGMTGGNEVLTEAYTMATAPEVTHEAPEASETPAEPAQETVSSPAAETASVEAASEEAEENGAGSKETTASADSAASENDDAAASENSAASDTAADGKTGKEEIKSADQIIEESLEGRQTTSLTSDLTGENKKKSELLADAAETAEESASSVTNSASGFVSIHVNGGSSSTAIAKALENAGAVSNAGAFDAYLCSKGYDRHLSTGDFRIPAGASDEDIALILMRRK